MNKVLLIISLTFLSISSFAQKEDSLVHAAAFSASGNTIALELGTKYYTYHGDCFYISVLSYDTTRSNDTLTVDVYFRVPFIGAGFKIYCHRTDTINIGTLSSSIKLIEVKMYTEYENIDTIHNKFDKYIYLPLNISEYSNTKEVHLYPNPATNTLNILVTNKEAIKNISITDISGRIVFTDNAPVLSNNLYQINTINFPEGMYFLHLATSDGNINTKRFIKTE